MWSGCGGWPPPVSKDSATSKYVNIEKLVCLLCVDECCVTLSLKVARPLTTKTRLTYGGSFATHRAYRYLCHGYTESRDGLNGGTTLFNSVQPASQLHTQRINCKSTPESSIHTGNPHHLKSTRIVQSQSMESSFNEPAVMASHPTTKGGCTITQLLLTFELVCHQASW